MKRTPKWLALFIGLLLAVANLRIIGQSLETPYTYYKDFAYDYISARAALAGEDSYADAQTLTRRHLPESPVTAPDHPSSHAPLSIAMVMPLAAIVNYPTAAAIWCGIELALIACCALLFWREVYQWRGKRLLLAVGLTSFFFLGWGPVRDEIGNGQWTIVLLALLMLCWLAWRSGRDGLCGVALGAALAVKLAGAPILLFLIVQKKWRSAAAALLAALGGNLLAVFFLRWGVVVNYYLHIGPQVTHLYRNAGHNYALWTLGWKMFEGSLRENAFGFAARPLFDLPQLARPVSALVCLAALAAGLVASKRLARDEFVESNRPLTLPELRPLDAAFGVLIYLSLLLNPVSWTYHIPLAILPLWMTFVCLRERGFPRRQTILGVLLLTIISMPFAALLTLQQILGTPDASVPSGIRLSFPVGMLSLLPAAALVGLCALLVWLNPRRDKRTEG